ncbi:MAG TPA: hypothetical protein VMT91_04750 [Anaerolineales bacterium]|nr:hypothetical protein [Anaerolineales bacterium]
MRKATRIVATSLGVLSGLAGLEHGIFETLQGNLRPDGWMFPSWGPSLCDPAKVWHGCEPAMTLVPNFLFTGILTIVLSLVILAWSAAFVQKQHGGSVLILLCVAQLLLGGGFFPPLIGLVGGIAGTRIRKALSGVPSGLTRLVARLWPWPLVILITWLVAQFPIGALFNDWLKSVMGVALLLIVILLPLSVWCAYAQDAVRAA